MSSEIDVINAIDGDREPSSPTKFTLDVEIGGSPYVFAGEVPSEPESFEFVVSLPQDKWSEIEPHVKAVEASSDHFAVLYHRLQSLGLGDGKVGSVWVQQAGAKDGAPSIRVSRIQTDNRYLPEGSEYTNARGVGVFILNNLCALADARGWRIYLEPLERDGRLTGGDLVRWYERRGFILDYSVSPEMQSDFGGMIRVPRQPDPAQPILSVIHI